MGFEEKYTDWIKIRIKTRKKLYELADLLDLHHNSTNGSKLKGISIGILGCASVLTGMLLAPTTFALSLSLTIGGISMGAIGCLTSVCISIKEELFIRKMCREAEDLINEETKKTNEMIKLVSTAHFRRQMANGISVLISKSAQEGLKIANLLNHATIAHNYGDTTNAAKILLSPSKIISVLNISLSLLFFGFEFLKLIETYYEVKDGSRSYYSDRLRYVAEKMENNMRDIEDILTKSIEIQCNL